MKGRNASASLSHSRSAASIWRRALAVFAAQVLGDLETPEETGLLGPTGRCGHHHGAECQLASPESGWLL